MSILLLVTGKERDYASGLDYFGARYYSSNMGRFMSPDDGSDQDSSDPRNNPLSNTDPTGNACVENSNGSTYDDSSGGESCADVANAPQVVSTTVTAQADNASQAGTVSTLLSLGTMAAPVTDGTSLVLAGAAAGATIVGMAAMDYFAQHPLNLSIFLNENNNPTAKDKASKSGVSGK